MANDITFAINALDRASGPLGKVNSSLGKVVKVIAGATAVLGAAGAATVAFANSIAKTNDQVGKFAKRLGVTTEALSALHHAASLSNISTQNMNLILQRQQRRVSEAAEGMGEAVGALRELNLNAVELKQLSLDEQFLTITDSLSKVADAGDRTRLAFKLFDSEGVAVNQMLSENNTQLRAAIDEATRYGAIVSGKAAAAAAEFNDSQTRMSAALRGVRNAMSEDLLPVITKLQNQLAEFIAENRGKIVAFFKSMIENSLIAFEVVSQTFSGIGELLSNTFSNTEADGFFTFILNGFKNLLSAALAFTSGFAEAIVQGAAGAFQMFFELGKWAFQNTSAVMIAGFSILTKAIATAFQVMWGVVAESAKFAWEKIKNIFNDTEVQGLSDRIGNRISESMLKFGDAIDTAVDNAKTKMPELGDTMEEVARIGEDTMINMSDAIGAGVATSIELVSKAGEEAGIALGVNLENIKAQVAETMQAMNAELEAAVDDQTKNIIPAQLTEMEKFYVKLKDLSQEWLDNHRSQGEQMAEVMFNIMENTTNAIGGAVAGAVVAGQNLAESAKTILKNVIGSIIQQFIAMRLQRLITAALGAKAAGAEAAANLAAGLSATFVNTMASVSAIPIVGPFMAPAVAAANVATATAGATAGIATGGALGAAIGGVAHGGLDNVPAEATYLLDRGERVLSPRQNQDLTDALAAGEVGGAGGDVTIEQLNIEILPNATNAEALLALSKEEMQRVVAGPILDALNDLDREGVRPEFAEKE